VAALDTLGVMLTSGLLVWYFTPDSGAGFDALSVLALLARVPFRRSDGGSVVRGMMLLGFAVLAWSGAPVARTSHLEKNPDRAQLSQGGGSLRPPTQASYQRRDRRSALHRPLYRKEPRLQHLTQTWPQ
jgi:hypothetical protein